MEPRSCVNFGRDEVLLTGVNGARGGDVSGKGSGLGDVTATAGSDFLLPAVSAQSLGVLALRTAVTEGEESWKTLEGAGGFLAFDLKDSNFKNCQLFL